MTNRADEHRPTLLTNLCLVNPAENTVTDQAWLRIHGGRIVEIGAGEASEGDSAVEDLARAFVIPGLWDVHVHPTGYVKNIPGETVAERTLRAVDELLEGLRAGVTSVRSAGESDYIDVAARDFFMRGSVVGPRVVPCGWAHITSVSPGQVGLPVSATEHTNGRGPSVRRSSTAPSSSRSLSAAACAGRRRAMSRSCRMSRS